MTTSTRITPLPQGARATSILPPEAHGVVYLTGPRGVGKTQFAAYIENPANVLFWDFESKGEAYHNLLHFGQYTSITRLVAGRCGMTYQNANVFEAIKAALDEVPQDRFTTLIVDNIKPLEDGLYAYVCQKASSFGLTADDISKNKRGGAWPHVKNLITGFTEAVHAKGIQLIVATAHLKDDWGYMTGQNGQPVFGPIPGKYKAVGLDRWQELSILSLYLIPGDYPPAPSAIVAKEQLGLCGFDPDTLSFIEPIRRMPQRLPKASWQAVRAYLETPANLDHPEPGEVPTPEELAPYLTKLKTEQILYLQGNQGEGEVADV